MTDLSALGAAAAILSDLSTVEATSRSLMHRLTADLKADAGTLWLEDDSGVFTSIASVGLEDDSRRLLVEGMADVTRRIGESFRGRDSAKAAPMESLGGFPGAIAVSLRIGERSLGALVLLRDSGVEFTDEEITILEVLASMIAHAFDRSSLDGKLMKQLADLQLSQAQMESYARDLRSTFTAEKQRSEELAVALAELQQTYLATVKGLAIAVEAKDAYTAGHIIRVTRYGLMMMDLIAPDEARQSKYEYGFLLHDIGKLSVPDSVLGKEGSLTDDEWKIMRLHADTGRRILEGIPFLDGAKEIVYSHHERWDGKGYPRGLKGEEIPLGARVFPVADSFDAMTTDRPYRAAMATEAALEEIRAGSGSQFWPVAVDTFLSIPKKALDKVRSESATWDALGHG